MMSLFRFRPVSTDIIVSAARFRAKRA
jgi:hypothetical protein